MRLDRHQIVRLDPGAWLPLIAARPALEAIPVVAEWVALGRPLIARGRLCSDGAGGVPLGLPLPPSMGKQRLTFAVDPGAVTETCLPPWLLDARRQAPVGWLATIADLLAIDREVRCFGSLAWEHLTGLPYLSTESDIDLLWHVSSSAKADRLVTAIAPVDARAPMRIDGEIVAPGGRAIQWREWAGGAANLLAKRWDGPQMVTRAEMFS